MRNCDRDRIYRGQDEQRRQRRSKPARWYLVSKKQYLYTALLVCVVATFTHQVCAVEAEPAPPTYSSLAIANQPIIKTKKVTWQDLLSLVESHPLTAAGRYTLEATRAQVDEAKAIPNPKLGATAAYGRARDSSESAFEWGLNLSIPLDWLVRRGVGIAAARSEVALSKAERILVKRELVLQLRILFYTLVESQERVAALDAMDKESDALQRTVQRRVEMGEVRPVEATRIAVETAKIRGALETAKIRLEGRRTVLAHWLSHKTAHPLVAVTDLNTLPTPMTPTEIIDTLKDDHPVLAEEAARLRALAAEVDEARQGGIPQFSAQLFADHELDRRAYGGGVSITLPLWNRNRPGIQRSLSLLESEKLRAKAIRLELETEALKAQSSCQATVTRAIHYRDSILPNAIAAAKTIQRTYELGEAPLLELIDVRRTLIETQGEFLDALVTAQTDCSRLYAIVGKDMK